MSWEIKCGHVLDVLKTLPTESAQCIVTSPPYFGLRTYKTVPQDWGDWTGELGLEPTQELYVQHLFKVFQEVNRVLRKDGTLWLNLGDSYAGSGQGWQKEGGSSIPRKWLEESKSYDKPPGYISSIITCVRICDCLM